MNKYQRLVGVVVTLRISVRSRDNLMFHIFCVVFLGSQVQFVRSSNQMIVYVGLCKISNAFFVVLFVIFDVLVCDNLAIHLERAEPTFRPSQAHVGSLGDCENLSRADSPQHFRPYIKVDRAL